MEFKKFGLVHALKLKAKLILFKKIGLVRRKVVSVNMYGRDLEIVENSLREASDLDTAWCFYLAKNSSIIFDVGVNTGQNAIMMLTNPQIQKMVLVEPNIEALSIAVENIMRNNLIHKVSVFRAFASDEVKENQKFWNFYGDASASMYESQAATARFTKQFSYVPATTLDLIAKFFDIIPDLIKLDVEGAEIKALNGAKEIALSNKTKFIVEVHTFPEMPIEKSVTLILQWCKEVNYIPYLLFDKSVLKSPVQVPKASRYHVLILPELMEFPKYLLKVKEGQEV